MVVGPRAALQAAVRQTSDDMRQCSLHARLAAAAAAAGVQQQAVATFGPPASGVVLANGAVPTPAAVPDQVHPPLAPGLLLVIIMVAGVPGWPKPAQHWGLG